MNPYLPTLQQALQSQKGVGAFDLDDVLFLLRAHYNLAGLVLCCRRLVELSTDFPWLRTALGGPGFAGFLSSVRAIAELVDPDPHFVSGRISANKDKQTPLRPFSGDSSLCDVLLIAAGDNVSGEQQSGYAWAQAWFAFQVVTHQSRTKDRSTYFAYLNQPEQEKGMVRLIDGVGSRLYGAMRVIRLLGDAAHAQPAAEIVDLLRRFGSDRSALLAGLLSAALNKRTTTDASRLAGRFGVEVNEVQAGITRVCSFDGSFGAASKVTEKVDLRLLSRFLDGIWRPSANSSSVNRASYISRRLRAERRKLEVERYGAVEMRPQPVEDGVAGGGVLVDVRRVTRRPRSADDDDLPAHRDPDEGPVEPELQIFIGDGDPVAAWYAGKSAAHHIEADNALLRWPRWRLSETAVAAICQLVVTADPSGTADSSQDWARLLIAISLATGRRLPSAHVRLVVEVDLPEDALAITVADKVLHVPAATPALAGHEFGPDPLPEFCAPWAASLRLPLPRAWHALIERLRQRTQPRQRTVEKAAQLLLETLPSEFGVSEKGIAHALKLALLEAGRDDLGLVKLLSDASEANTDNLIHYASYERREVEALWSRIVSAWAGAPDDVALPRREGERVGSPFGVEIPKVADAIASLKEDIRSAIDDKQWVRLQTLMVLYTALWANLGTAGRGTTRPIPALVTASGWALVQDKHRSDASTDRLVPLTQELCKQIQVQGGLAEAFALLDPERAQPEHEGDSRRPLFVFAPKSSSKEESEAEVRLDYQPSLWRSFDAIAKLPRNWARRLVRCESPELLGRFKDAGLGHWVRGRHPWAWTSTFPAQRFREDWLALQARLEKALGFEVIRVPELAAENSGKAPELRRRADGGEDSASRAGMTDAEVEALLQTCSRNGEFEALKEVSTRNPAVARWLVQEALAELQKEARGSDGKPSDRLPVEAMESVCAYLRKEHGIPVFITRPRARFQRNWLVEEDAFVGLIRIERKLLPAIERDLRALPPLDLRAVAASPPLGAGSSIPVRSESHAVRVGRLIAALALRGGLMDIQHVDALFTAYGAGKPIEAIGEARLIELMVRSKRSALPMRRTLLLEPYLSVLLMTEKSAIDEGMAVVGQSLTRRRYEYWQTSFRAYLRALGLRVEISLSYFFGALRQKLMLEGSPLLAAYASGELFTHDLPASEFRRLAGFEPLVSTDDTLGQVDAAGEDSQDDTQSLEGDAWHGFDSKAAEWDDTLPEDLLDRDKNLAQYFARRKSPLLQEWRRLTRSDVARLKPLSERLLGCFALNLIEAQIKAVSGQSNPRATKGFRRSMMRNLDIVWAALSQYRGHDEALDPLGDGVLRRLMDLTLDHFPVRRHRAAWSRFRSFLMADGSAERIAEGFRVTLAKDPFDEFVSAKILSREELERIEARLGSVLSGIGNPLNRRAAQVHFAITRDLGARRAETELLRSADLHGDLLQIQEYEGRTLKTKASARVAPLGLLAPALQSQIFGGIDGNTVIESVVGESVAGYNFFDAVSKAMKAETGDGDLGLHHLRHSKASLLLLRMLDNVASMQALVHELPWLPSSLPDEDAARHLLGSAGQAGQGLKVIASLLGHLHETTTLHHYVHTLGIALYAHQLSQPQIPLPAAFRNRLAIGSTLYRYQQKHQAAGVPAEAINRLVRNDIEKRGQYGMRVATPNATTTPFMGRTVAPLCPAVLTLAHAGYERRAQEEFARFEAIEAFLLSGKGEAPQGADHAVMRLRELGAIPSGKRGVRSGRHPLPVLGRDGTRLPRSLLAGLPARYALALLAWLLRLKEVRPDDFEWLIDRWIHGSHARIGSMRLPTDADVRRAGQLPRDPDIEVVVGQVCETASRKREGTNPRYEMTLKFGARLGNQEDGKPKERWRAAGAVRWVMTWAVAVLADHH